MIDLLALTLINGYELEVSDYLHMILPQNTVHDGLSSSADGTIWTITACPTRWYLAISVPPMKVAAIDRCACSILSNRKLQLIALR